MDTTSTHLPALTLLSFLIFIAIDFGRVIFRHFWEIEVLQIPHIPFRKLLTFV